MLDNIRDHVVTIAVGLVMLIALLVFFIVTLEKSPFIYSDYQIGQVNFESCAEDFQQTNSLYQQYQNKQILTMSESDLITLRNSLDQKSSCTTDYLVSNDTQIREYAENLYEYINAQGYEQQLSLLDTVYTAPASYYGYTQTPQDYLYFAMSEDEQVLLGFIYTPTEDGFQIETLWTYQQGDDLETVQAMSKNLLVKYYEKVI